MAFRFLHTSDWHLGRLFHQVSLLDDQRAMLEQIIDIAVQQKVRAVIIAGDVYDRATPPADAITLFDETVNTLIAQHGIDVLCIAGNHDSAERMGFGARQMQASGLHIVTDFKTLATPIELEQAGVRVNFYGIPYAVPQMLQAEFNVPLATQDEAIAYCTGQIPNTNNEIQQVVLSHCFVAGASICESERALSVGGAEAVNWRHFQRFDYTALGHLHGPQQHGAAHIRYSGSPLKYSFSEQSHAKSLVLVELDGVNPVKTTLIPLLPKRDVRSIEGTLEFVLNTQSSGQSPDYVQALLSDSHAILDAVGQLRAVFPNLLNVQRTGMQASEHLQSPRLKKQLEVSQAFADFFQQAVGEALSPEQTQALNKAVTNSELH